MVTVVGAMVGVMTVAVWWWWGGGHDPGNPEIMAGWGGRGAERVSFVT